MRVSFATILKLTFKSKVCLGVLLRKSQMGRLENCNFQLYFVGFNFISNLIVFLQSFTCMFVGFNVGVECVKLVKNYEEKTTRNLLTIGPQVDNP